MCSLFEDYDFVPPFPSVIILQSPFIPSSASARRCTALGGALGLGITEPSANTRARPGAESSRDRTLEIKDTMFFEIEATLFSSHNES